ncbi:MAG: peptide chain release factor N(5)-glutamine methyltransferase [Pseudomonadota bacterium]
MSAALGAGAPRRSAGELLAASGLPPAEARSLLAHASGTRREALVAFPERAVDEAAAQCFAALAQRRRAGEPMAYLLGVREFLGRDFEVCAAVLVPRPETELLVELGLGWIAGRPAPRVVDLGTGSGCIAVSLALARPDAQVTGTDLSAAALAVAGRNAARLGAPVRWREGAWYAALEPDERFELIVANPPYVAAGDPHLAALRFEPQGALTDDADGLACLRALAAGAPQHLAPGGWVALEHGYDQGAAVRQLLAEAGLLEAATWRDLAGHERVSAARAPG